MNQPHHISEDLLQIKLVLFEKMYASVLEMQKYDEEYKRHWNSGARENSNKQKEKIYRIAKEIKSKQIKLL